MKKMIMIGLCSIFATSNVFAMDSKTLEDKYAEMWELKYKNQSEDKTLEKVKELYSPELAQYMAIEKNMPLLTEFINVEKYTIVDFLIEKGINLNEKSSIGWTALMYAIDKNNMPLVEKLIKHKDIDLNVQDPAGRTALMLAVDTYNVPVVEKLIEHKVDVTFKNRAGRTAYDFAKNKLREIRVGEIGDMQRKKLHKIIDLLNPSKSNN